VRGLWVRKETLIRWVCAAAWNIGKIIRITRSDGIAEGDISRRIDFA
jgi:hypothetical protein